jgi:hypothetical protein
LTACFLPKIIEERVYSLLTVNNTYLKGVDYNFSKVNATRKTFQRAVAETDTYQVGWLWISQKFSMGLLDFNNHWKFWFQSRKKALSKIRNKL